MNGKVKTFAMGAIFGGLILNLLTVSASKTIYKSFNFLDEKNILYRSVMGREISSEERLSNSSVANLLSTDEYKNSIDDYIDFIYNNLLDREPDPAGKEFWKTRFPLEIFRGIMSSDEYQTKDSIKAVKTLPEVAEYLNTPRIGVSINRIHSTGLVDIIEISEIKDNQKCIFNWYDVDKETGTAEESVYITPAQKICSTPDSVKAVKALPEVAEYLKTPGIIVVLERLNVIGSVDVIKVFEMKDNQEHCTFNWYDVDKEAGIIKESIYISPSQKTCSAL